MKAATPTAEPGRPAPVRRPMAFFMGELQGLAGLDMVLLGAALSDPPAVDAPPRDPPPEPRPAAPPRRDREPPRAG